MPTPDPEGVLLDEEGDEEEASDEASEEALLAVDVSVDVDVEIEVGWSIPRVTGVRRAVLFIAKLGLLAPLPPLLLGRRSK